MEWNHASAEIYHIRIAASSLLTSRLQKRSYKNSKLYILQVKCKTWYSLTKTSFFLWKTDMTNKKYISRKGKSHMLNITFLT